ncbi:MAG TPA: thiol reductant ABC exporter subunit CydC [Streptosporangiaceae bacterium]|nr:thiol reductant ABC exporter subunit CydC [Streptosporangiaceae bacterium]
MTAVQAPAPGGPHPLVRLLRLARPLRGQLVLATAAGAASTGCAVALLATSGFLLARASLHPNIVAISVAVVAVRALSVGRGVFRYVERLASHDAAFRVLADVRVQVYRRLARLAPAGLRDFRSGDLLARLVSDVDATQDLFIRGLAPPLTAFLVGVAAAGVTAVILAPAGLVLAAGLLLAGLPVSWLAAIRARQAARRTAAARGELAARVTDLLAGSADLHAAGAQDAALAAADDADHELTRLARGSAAGAALGSGLSQAVAGLTLWGVLLLGVAAVGAGTLTRVPLAVITLTALAAFEAVTGLPAAAIQLGQARSSAARVGAVLDAPDPVAEPAAPRPLPSVSQPGGARHGGPVRVALRGAQVRYEAGGPLAIDGVDLDLPPGRRVALIGPSGSGKSTVAAVLLRFVELAGGSATLDGADLGRYSAADVRTVISGCAQDPHLFDTTIADNIRLARPGASQQELDDVAVRARLLSWIQSLPAGWDTMVGPGGTAVSGGERQRIALARALLADPPLLILDEPTAHLDPENRRALTADLLAETQGRATLFITHDLDGLDQVDEIVVLDHGRVAERGSHAGLLRAGGLYHRMQAAAQDRPAG